MICPKTTFVAQEGGDHYQAEYQHWDWVVDIGMGYLAGNATKYVSRWAKKNGIADLKKAMTYVDKMLAVYKGQMMPSRVSMSVQALYSLNKKFFDSSDMDPLECLFCSQLSQAYDHAEILTAKKTLECILEAAQAVQPPPAMVVAPAPVAGAGGAAYGAGGGAMVQGAAGSASTGVVRNSLDGMEHPFGYDEWHEGSV
jgi:hypothetical protein